MAHPPLLLLPILVAMAAAAPLAENVNKEQAVRVSGDVAVVDRAKRSKEVVAFDNQQNSEKLGLAKKSLQDPVDLPVAGLNAGQSSPLEDSADKTGVVFASEERMISPENKVDETEIREEVAGEDIAANNVLAPATLATAAVAGEEPLSSAHHEAGQEASGEGHAVSEPEPEVAVLTQLPENSQSADAEEVFLGGQQQEPQVLQANSKDSDDVEEMLKELRVEDEPVQIEDESSVAENEKMTDTQLLHVAGNDENKDLTRGRRIYQRLAEIRLDERR
ncbi:uncharacterized protein LOC112566569 [Pomacea canaliculata]|nr:uncharacterized protein LOC112566569 [Pomacea canaliculata]